MSDTNGMGKVDDHTGQFCPGFPLVALYSINLFPYTSIVSIPCKMCSIKEHNIAQISFLVRYIITSLTQVVGTEN